MARPYKVLTPDEQDDMLVLTLLSQERDHFMYSQNAARYQAILTSLLPGDPNEPFQKRIAELVTTEAKALAQSERILTELDAQLPPAGRITSSIARLRAKGVVP